MTDQAPAGVLRAAATELRAAAEKAIHEGRSTWVLGATRGSKSPVVVDDPERPSVLIETWAERLEDVNAYLTFVPPAVGLALADWMDALAEGMTADPDPRGGLTISERHALATAHAVLGVAR